MFEYIDILPIKITFLCSDKPLCTQTSLRMIEYRVKRHLVNNFGECFLASSHGLVMQIIR